MAFESGLWCLAVFELSEEIDKQSFKSIFEKIQ